MCGNKKCKWINIFYLTDDEKVMIHYDDKHRPIWIQHFKGELERTFIEDIHNQYDAIEAYKPKIKILNTLPSVLYDC
jgi:hypothetical protein